MVSARSGRRVAALSSRQPSRAVVVQSGEMGAQRVAALAAEGGTVLLRFLSDY